AAVRFRQRLASLVDDLLDHPMPEGTSFLLDGQTAVFSDALPLRPRRMMELIEQLRSGALEAGPWFVLADELIPSGEALVRNLLMGRRTLHPLGAEAPPVLYCPDSFGHPAALPALAQGFGFETVIVWRGFGGRRWPAGDACWWRGPSGERVLLYHLPPSGYELGANLPADADAAAARWHSMRDQLVPRARLSVALLLNGADHHARQRKLSAAVAALGAAAAPIVVRAASLREFATAVRAAADAADLPDVAGELRDSYGYTWTLQGTLSTRAAQKRRNARAERLLGCEVEPWAALAKQRTGRSFRDLVNTTWHTVLLCHPHDTLCGCSIDVVARAFDARMDEVEAQGCGLRDDALAELVGYDAERARLAPEAWQPHVVVRNPVPRPRGGVAIVKLSRFLAHVPVGPGSAQAGSVPPARLGPRRVHGAGALQVLSREVVHERTESLRAYPDDDLVERAEAAIWVAELPGFGIRALPLESGRPARGAVPHPVRVTGRSMSNGRLHVDVGADGKVSLRDEESGCTVADLLAFEDQDDAGDLYTPALRGAVRSAGCVGVHVVHRGPLRATIETRWRVAVRRGQSVAARLRLSLDADATVLRIALSGENGADDHRLRLRVRTDVAAPVVHADAAFGPVERIPLSIPPEDAAMEAVVPTAPLHRYVTLSDARRGMTLVSDGLTEYEADTVGDVHVTLVRAVGELSRGDLPERPGHAGWPSPTPEAQCRGALAAELAVLLHGPWGEETVELVERAAEDVLVPIMGETLRSMITAPPDSPRLELQGGGLVCSSVKESEDGEWIVLRCVNVLDRAVPGRWVVSGGVREARLSRLDESPGDPVPVAGDVVEFEAPPRGVVTVLVR
ncbi:MAG: glycoside hydrolase family 38 C-terminal domain-containing protein, partial [Gemmatimonadaceae bacterium]